jgi:hypothetical protein
MLYLLVNLRKWCRHFRCANKGMTLSDVAETRCTVKSNFNSFIKVAQAAEIAACLKEHLFLCNK